MKSSAPPWAILESRATIRGPPSPRETGRLSLGRAAAAQASGATENGTRWKVNGQFVEFAPQRDPRSLAIARVATWRPSVIQLDAEVLLLAIADREAPVEFVTRER